MYYSAKIFSRIGELMQGFLADGSAFLISGLPSRNFFSEAVLEDLAPAPAASTSAPATSTSAPAASAGLNAALPPKAAKALTLFLEKLKNNGRPANNNLPAASNLPGIPASKLLRTPASNLPRIPATGLPAHPAAALPGSALPPLTGKSIRLSSNIPPGKGLASSSADILSVLYVVNDYLQTGFTAADLYHIAARVEPTDPCLSENIVLFKQHLGMTDRSICLPPLALLYFDAEPARQVETLSVQRPFSTQTAHFFEGLLRQFLRAADQQDRPSLFDCITRSAVANQSIISLPRFDDYYRLAETMRSGLMVAHSGTIAGFLTDPELVPFLLPQLERMAPTAVHVELYLSPLSR